MNVDGGFLVQGLGAGAGVAPGATAAAHAVAPVAGADATSATAAGAGDGTAVDSPEGGDTAPVAGDVAALAAALHRVLDEGVAVAEPAVPEGVAAAATGADVSGAC